MRVNLFSLLQLNQILSPRQISALLSVKCGRKITNELSLSVMIALCCANAFAFNFRDKCAFNALVV